MLMGHLQEPVGVPGKALDPHSLFVQLRCLLVVNSPDVITGGAFFFLNSVPIAPHTNRAA